jgi:hypothetical protein
MLRAAVAMVTMAGALSGCGASGSGSLPAAGARPVSDPERTGVVAVPAGSRVTSADVEAATRADAAQFWGRSDPASLRATIESVTWPDGSIGCPRPGLMYTQALVPGYRIVVTDGARELIYHASARGHWVLCPAARASAPLPGSATR